MSLIPTHNQTLITDLYQLTMAAGYYSRGMQQTSSFELYVRRLPKNRNFLVAAGLEQALDYLENLRFEAKEIAYLQSLPVFSNVDPSFWDYLKNFRFEGEVWALREGSVFFPYEPILRVTAPVIQAQLVETWLLSLINYQTSVASKAARIWLACQSGEKPVDFVDFGSRRAHGPEASVLATRAAYLGGAVATANVYAGMHLGLPVKGTAAHSWTMAFESEPEAFAAYHAVFPHNSVLLIDTYDTAQGARHATALGSELQGVRLDSGDFLSLSREVRQILDAAGLEKAKIVVSGDMNEDKIAALMAEKAPIDIFGVGTELVTSIDAPSLGGVYKLVEQTESDGTQHYRVKLSSSKVSYPGIKQVWRTHSSLGFSHDLLALQGESISGAMPQLSCVMKAGKRLQAPPALPLLREICLEQLQNLPERLQALPVAEEAYPVTQSPALRDLFASLKAEYEKNQAERSPL
ncbi:nicotinate phosphoribosyltransferase [bacterium (Candidatus Blackallbacteria) CG17_big_fil_post_rev_8_21_14_2_50_48_46]|uniref:Nicotinate phosphoribosyltransferase n=1 Tax=bacterium (Candidatus Blackallbacteria) CG17_big_fil_post_rev_8_21_14_2_50_48_46 TaxID=2014261 RepID=A0A2M7G2W8_9BACT|nr:MAG: nicotinate phosphoribosyltransferase [bacterium (Candidatus Blackallbacteria) CG18_big_fil_WC_8_21_14_2_50_49_26]PIW16137.1 MAG: nicotinate phosphoribosyltransferase [bacterium (Candidatus Blackallbacteria) CG17_big_fil_post_rev_8_21_14_2_50_48_46]PIW44224.1 MAG: nicotinate phosphoribosyltransferase [bacterium (Candidatus Blackallbacteria) CG13_big_fil_rev_8_21_14_2_50_49_14]